MIKIIINSYRNVVKEREGGKLDNLKEKYKQKLIELDEKYIKRIKK